MTAQIIIGGDPQPDSGARIVIGTSPAGSALFEVTLPPGLPKGSVVLVLIVRDGPVIPPPGWVDKVIDGNGGAGFFLDGWAKMIDGTEPSTVAFLSTLNQAILGHAAIFENTAPSYMIEAIATAAVAADATPTTPSVLCQQAASRIFKLLAVTGVATLTPPTGYELEDTYANGTDRTLLVASKPANASGTIPAVDAGASLAVTGRSWSIVVRNNPPITAPTLVDSVPGHIGLIGPR